MAEKKVILTPTGRLVGGDPFVGNTTDFEGRPLTTQSGDPRVQFLAYVAIPKAEFGPIWADMVAKAREDFPALTFDAQGTCNNPAFSYKITDGDSTVPNTQGIKPCDKEGYPGNFVLKMSTGFAPGVYAKGGAEKIVDPEMLKRGFYVRAYGSIAGNGQQAKPGLYVNLTALELVGPGAEISSGPDGATMFGGAPAAVPAGVLAMPAAGTPIAMPAAAPIAAAPIVAAPAGPGDAPIVAAPVAVTPAPGFMAPPVAAPVAEEMRIGSDGKPYARSVFIGLGWVDAQIDTLPLA